MNQFRELRERASELLEEVIDLPLSERRPFVERVCADNAPLRDEVLSLLAALDRGGDLLEPSRAGPTRTLARGDQSLTGFRFGAYVVGERIGAGGMGVVYRATDARLGRDVAVKALPTEFAGDTGRRARLEQEARALAVLNHPHIAAIYGAEETERGSLLLLEFIPGQTLAQIIARGRLPVDDVIAIARQITLGLEAAHSLGVVHRDLKPANIRVTDDGVVKILDFGIAEIVTSADSPAERSTEPRAGSSSGLGSGLSSGSSSGLGSAPRDVIRIVGTAAYMSPEQARGRRADRRADLWAFGCVLFEMLAGVRPFVGETTSDTVAAVLHSEPTWSRLPTDVPPSLRRLIERCLRKDPERRLRDAADARLDLADAEEECRTPAASVRGSPRWRFAAVTALAAASFAVGIAIGRGRTQSESMPVRFGVHADVSLPLEWDRGASFSIHSDATEPARELLAFTGTERGEPQGLFLQGGEDLRPRRIDVVAHTPRTPLFSPNGEWIAYAEVETGRLMRYGVQSGTVEEFGVAEPDANGLAWLDSDTLLYSNESGLMEIDLGGATRSVLSRDAAVGDLAFGHPCVLPGGDTLLFTRRHGGDGASRCSIEAMRRSSGERWTIRDDAWTPILMDDHTLLWCEASGLFASSFDVGTARVQGKPSRILESLGGADELFPAARFAVSSNGTLAYLPDVGGVEPTGLAWMHRDGRLDRILAGEHLIHVPRLSPREERVVYTLEAETREIWVHDFVRGSTQRVGPEDGRSRDYALWLPDGRSIAVASYDDTTQRIERLNVDQSAEPEILLERARSVEATPNSLAPDGKSILITMANSDHRRDLFLLPIGGGEPTPAFPLSAARTGGRFSPDGRAILYLDETTEALSVVAESWPDLKRRVQVSERTGVRAEWRPDGRTIFYRDGRELWEVDIATVPELSVGPRRLVFDSFPDVRYTVSADGSRLLLPIGSGERRNGTTFAIHRRFSRVVHNALGR